jgi:hypothetical protein
LFTCTEGTPDCERRHRLPGVRRFNTLLTTLSESSNLNRLPLEQCHTLGVRSIAIIGEAPVGSSTFVIDTGARTSQSQRARGKTKNTHYWLRALRFPSADTGPQLTHRFDITVCAFFYLFLFIRGAG